MKSLFAKLLKTVAPATLLVAFSLTGSAEAGPYPRKGSFKQLHFTVDKWYYIDNTNWIIKAPDKWVHFMGSYSLGALTYRITGDRFFAGLFTLGLGVLKEVDDGYREGWSQRDLYMDATGLLSSLVTPDNVRLLAYYDDNSIMFKMSFILD